MIRGTKIICLRRKVLAAVGCVVAAFLMCWVVSSPKVVGAAATERQLPIYCVQKDYKVLSISFDAAWGDGRVRRFSISKIRTGRQERPSKLPNKLTGFLHGGKRSLIFECL